MLMLDIVRPRPALKAVRLGALGLVLCLSACNSRPAADATSPTPGANLQTPAFSVSTNNTETTAGLKIVSNDPRVLTVSAISLGHDSAAACSFSAGSNVSLTSEIGMANDKALLPLDMHSGDEIDLSFGLEDCGTPQQISITTNLGQASYPVAITSQPQ